MRGSPLTISTMRDIKFRGARIDNSEFFKGFLVRTSGKTYILKEWHLPEIWGNKHLNDLEHYQVNENSVGQFTGLLDTNEVEIYEGDIIDFDNLLGDDTQRGFICFRNGCFRVSNKLGVMNSYDTEIRMLNDGNNEWYSIENLESFDIEVIGNIHQNPELLK